MALYDIGGASGLSLNGQYGGFTTPSNLFGGDSGPSSAARGGSSSAMGGTNPSASRVVQAPGGSIWNPVGKGNWILSPDQIAANEAAGQKANQWNAIFGAMMGQLNKDPYTIGGSAGPTPQINTNLPWNFGNIQKQT